MSDSALQKPQPDDKKSEVRTEVLTTTALAAISALPWVGSPLAELLGGYLGHRAQKRVLELIAQVEQRVGDRINRIDELEERRQEQVLRIILEARLATEKEHLERLRNAATNVIFTDIEDAWFAALNEAVAQVRTEEVRLLSVFYSLPESARGENGTRKFFPRAALEKQIGDVPADLLRTILNRGIRLGLLEDVGIGVIGVQPLEYLERTELGRRFMNFIKDPTTANVTG